MKTVIDGFTVEMENCDGSMCCFISKGHCSNSLQVAQDQGYIESDSPRHDDIFISDATLNKIEEYALAHGY